MTGEPAPIDEPGDTGPRRPHQLFDRIPTGPSGALEAITERRVAQARADGLFDDLPGAGKPIPDIDRHRPPGWWAQRFVATERRKVRAMELEEELAQAMAPLWRLESADEVAARVAELNETIATYNRITDLATKPMLDLDETLATWRRLSGR